MRSMGSRMPSRMMSALRGDFQRVCQVGCRCRQELDGFVDVAVNGGRADANAAGLEGLTDSGH
jgi:hypothetical protein